jgi:mevalonate kinase
MASRSSAAGANARAPGKAILFGEHAVNRGEPAIAASVGLHARASVHDSVEHCCRFRGGGKVESATREDILELARRVDAWRAAGDHESIRRLAAEDFFAPSKYILGSAFGDGLPPGLEVEWESEIPPSSGLGSGGAAFAALAAAIGPLLPRAPSREETAALAHRGDVIAHGGIASALDTQASLLGGVILFKGNGLADRVACAPGLSIVIGNTGVKAATSDVNGRVRRWLAERPEARLRFFRAIGAASRAALPALAAGDWEELGRLFTLNQLALERIGVSCPEIDILVEAAMGAGAFGAKLSGSGGGGIVIALAAPETRESIAEAMRAACAEVLVPEIGVPGAAAEALRG